MGKRRLGIRGRQGKSLSVFKKKLLRHINSCQIKHPTVDELVEYLRSNYPEEYSRQKFRALAKNVNDILKESGSRRPDNSISSDSDNESSGDHDSSSQLRKLEQVERREERNGVCTSEETSSSDCLMKGLPHQRHLEKRKTKALRDKVVEMEVVNDNGKGEIKVDLFGDGDKMIRAAELDLEGKGGEGQPGVDAKDKGSGPRFKDLGGMNDVLEELNYRLVYPLRYPHIPQPFGVKLCSGILLHGDPGCGKTTLAHAIANETGLPFYKISATELVSGVSGASEENIRDLFSKAYRTAPSIVFIDEIDAIASKREDLQREMARRIVTQLMTCMDESHRIGKYAEGKVVDLENSGGRLDYVLIIGATNRPGDIDSALRRSGRFDREIALGLPDENARLHILSVLTQNIKVEDSLDHLKIARAAPGFAGADLVAMINEARQQAMMRVIGQRSLGKDMDAEECWRRPWSPEEEENLIFTMADFEEAIKMVQPSTKREGFSAIPNVTWEDVGGLHHLRQELESSIVRRIKYPKDYEDYKVVQDPGFLLYGPPGCGKTLIAKAVANESGANFIHIKGPELLNMYVGESEKQVREIFLRARRCAPCIVFFDEVDSLTTKRGNEGGPVAERILTQLLIELDGGDKRKGVYVIGATNRPDLMDGALIRPGRFGKLVYVPLPNPEERGLILKALAKDRNHIDTSVDLLAIGSSSRCENFSGADLRTLMDDAAALVLDEKLTSREGSSDATRWNIKDEGSSDATRWNIKDVHFKRALEKISPSVFHEQKQFYDRLSESLKKAA